MKKLFLIFLCVLGNLSAHATVYTVCNEPVGLAQFDGIQPAIDAASSGDTIYVHGSLRIYNTFIISNKRLTIIGPGWKPDGSPSVTAKVAGAHISGSGASGSEIHGLVFAFGDVSIDAENGTIPSNLRFIRNQFDFDFSIGRNFASGKTFENFVFEGNYFNNASLAGKNTNKHRGFVFRNNLFTVSNVLFGIPNSDNFVIDHNLFYQLSEQTENEIAFCNFFLITNNIFNGMNLITTSTLVGVSSSTFRNNITFDVDNSASPENIAPWTVNNNIDGGGNIANTNPLMADQDAVNAGVNNPLLDFTIATGPANNSASDGKDMGLLFDPSGTLNWNDSRNSTLPRVIRLSIQPTNSQDTLRLFASASKRPNTADFLKAEYFLNNDPGVGLGLTVEFEQSTADLISFTSLVPLNGLSEGTHQLSIRVQLSSGTWSLFETVSFFNANGPPVANAGTDQLITLPRDSTFLDASASFDPDGFIIYYRWTKVSGPEQGTIDNSEGAFMSAFALAKDLAAGTYQFELTVFDNSFFSAFGTDTVTIVVNSPPVANAGADKAINLPTNNVTLNGTGSFDPGGMITSFQWRSITGPSGAILQSPDQATTLVSNLSLGEYTFELAVTDNHGATDKDTVKVTVHPELTFPVASAGADRTVVLPNSVTKLDGRVSFDPDGTIITFAWKKISGPSGGTLITPTQSVTFAANLVAGIYQFELQVTDDSGLKDTDIVKVTVTNPPVANAGTDKTITLPTNSVTLNGSASFDPDGTIVKFLWSKISGPSGATITSPAQAVTSVKNLVEGIYQFRLVVTDNLGGSGSDVVQVTVNGPATRVATASRISNSDNSISAPGVDDEHQSTKVYPNPFREKINVTVPVQCSGTLVDVLGRTLFDLKLSAGVNEISTDKLEPGFYYLHVGRKTVKVQRE